MTRWAFIALLCGAAAPWSIRTKALREALQNESFVEGRNAAFEIRRLFETGAFLALFHVYPSREDGVAGSA